MCDPATKSDLRIVAKPGVVVRKLSTELLTVLVAENRESCFLIRCHIFLTTELLAVLVVENREIQSQRKSTGCGKSSVLVAFRKKKNENMR